MDIESVLGRYHLFFAELNRELESTSILVAGCPISHLCFRVTTFTEYESKRDALKQFSESFVEDEFNGRAISMFVLKSPLALSDTHAARLIELPAPRAAHMYASGLEHAGFVVGDSLPAFHDRHQAVLSGTKDRGPDCRPSFIEFPDGKSASSTIVRCWKSSGNQVGRSGIVETVTTGSTSPTTND